MPSSLLLFANPFMDVVLRYIFSLAVLYSMFLNPCHGLHLKLFNASKIQNDYEWQIAKATWYGAPYGGGSDGGACGYGDSVERPPLSKFISAGGPSLFMQGSGCGACYEVKCTENAECSGYPVHVIIADECPGCTLESVHFDLSGTAFGSMAKQGQADNLRNAGLLNVQYRRFACYFGRSITFTIDDRANPYYFATEIEYENGDGDLAHIELKQISKSDTWIPLHRLWGARWALNSGSQLQAPFSLRLTETTSKTVVANNVIPRGWQPGQVYRSFVNF